MIFIAAYLLAASLLPHRMVETVGPATSEIRSSWAPQWVDLGLDSRHRQVWMRIQRNPTIDYHTLFEIYAAGHLVKSKSIETDSYFEGDVPATVATVKGNWFLFYDSHPGAGDTWFTNYLVIRKRDYRFEERGQFEHGDASKFQSSRRYREYKLLKYQGDHRYRQLGVIGFKIIEWKWNSRTALFRRIRHWYSPRLPNLLSQNWYVQPWRQLKGELVGTPTFFRPADPVKHGLPFDSHFMIAHDYGFGQWTVGLVTGKATMDELHLIQGIKDLAGLDYPIGEVAPHNPPRISQSSKGMVLTITTCVFHKVRVSDFLVTTKPYKISLLRTRLQPEWTPFQGRATGETRPHQ